MAFRWKVLCAWISYEIFVLLCFRVGLTTREEWLIAFAASQISYVWVVWRSGDHWYTE